MLVTFHYITFALIFFRITNLNLAIQFALKPIIIIINSPKLFFQSPTIGYEIFKYIIPLIILDWYLRRDERSLKVPNNIYIRRISYLIIAMLIFIHFDSTPNSFIYFQF